jgi:hypothetical protein
MTTPPPPAPGQAIPAVPAPGQAIPAAPTITTGPAEPSTPTTAKPWPFKPAGNSVVGGSDRRNDVRGTGCEWSVGDGDGVPWHECDAILFGRFT